MFEEPLHNRMRHRYVPVDTLFDAHLDSPQDSCDNPNADFNASVGLRIVSRRRFCTDLLDVLALDLDHLQGRPDKGLNRRFLASLQDEVCMADSFNVSEHHIGY